MSITKPSILIVDDDRYNIMILEEYLDDYDYQLSSASDGEQAWSLLENNPKSYNIVLLDWNMPKLDGLEVLKLIKAHSELKHVYVIMQTTNAMDAQVKKGMDAGADDYITKPYEGKKILSSVEQAINKISEK